MQTNLQKIDKVINFFKEALSGLVLTSIAYPNKDRKYIGINFTSNKYKFNIRIRNTNGELIPNKFTLNKSLKA